VFKVGGNSNPQGAASSVVMDLWAS